MMIDAAPKVLETSSKKSARYIAKNLVLSFGGKCSKTTI